MRSISRSRSEAEAFTGYLESRIGVLEIRADGEEILEVAFVREKGPVQSRLPECLKRAITQLEEYFQGERMDFDLPLGLRGTAFQLQVWEELRRIPFAETISYGDLAGAVGRPRAFRAVGQANNKNPLPIVVPCHRVVGGDGSLTGYGSGIWRKEWLLEHEQRVKKVPGSRFTV
ncbi:MAG: methylated-DNA--[protein]-cysteine S-methyltransferase [Desulfohalobiaceae bacterium]|nr:methylated-DNA--[protein]-cysteine S-methyltransferase [Desulfohalobiaceae bacterium]